MDTHDIEIYYGLHGGKPVLIGAGSWEDVARINRETQVIDETTPPDRTAVTSPGTKHFYRVLGEIAGIPEATDEAMHHYEAMVEQAREKFLEQLRDNA